MPVSNKPSDHQSGGNQFGISAGKVEVVDAVFAVDQYATNKQTGDQGAFMTVARLSLQMLNDNWEPDASIDVVDNNYGCGGKFSQASDGTYHLTFYPTNDPNSAYDKDSEAPQVGTTGVFLEGPRQPDKLSRWSQFMAACVKNGLNESKVDADIRFMIGAKFELGTVKFAGVGGKEESIAAPISRFHTYPYEVKPVAKGKAATPAAKKQPTAPPAKATSASAPAPAEESGLEATTPAAAETASTSTNGRDTNALSIEIIEAVINNARGRKKDSITLKNLSKDVTGQVFQPKFGLNRAEQKAVIANSADPEFLGVIADSLSVTIDGETIKI
jgi:hypothetical protein